jgi:PD-(D/E)XK nuclease superfamily
VGIYTTDGWERHRALVVEMLGLTTTKNGEGDNDVSDKKLDTYGRQIVIRQSDIRQFLNCPRSYYLTKTLGASEYKGKQWPVHMSKADIGTLVHAGIAAHYELGTREAAMAVMDEALTDMAKERGHDIAAFFMANVGPYTMAQAMLARYIIWSGYADVFLYATVTETYFEFEWEGYLMTGTIDLTGHDDTYGGIVLLDHKTVATMNQVPRPNDFQLIHYCWAYWKMTGIVPAAAGHNLIKRVLAGNAPHNNRHLININQEMLELHEQKLQRILPRMQAALCLKPSTGLLVEANITGECSWKCPVKDLCDVMDDPNNDWIGMAETIYNVEKSKLV